MVTTPSRYEADLARWRHDRDSFFGSHYASPLPEDVMGSFAGLAYFPADRDLVFMVELEPDAADAPIASSSGHVARYPVAGRVTIPFPDGAVTVLALRGEEDDVYIPFRDLTNGVSSYAAGRYVAVERAGDGGWVVDFNRSINPYCAYDEEFSCPLPPPANWLERPIAAGERDFVSG